MEWAETEDGRIQSVQRQLTLQGFTRGLIAALFENRLAFSLFLWLMDNSGSMQHRDGHRIVQGCACSDHPMTTVQCSRWTELQETATYQAHLAAKLRAPSTFRLLNDPGRLCGPQIFSIAVPNDLAADEATEDTSRRIEEELSIAVDTIQKTQATGVTKLIPHIQAIRRQVVAMLPQLEQTSTKVAIIVATDGLPTDSQGNETEMVRSEFVSVLRSLHGLPVWVVVRLCTDEEYVVNFWNKVDEEVELRMEVLDDYESEAKEIHQVNPWLTYGLPLHRMREMGFHHTLFDALDERPLSRDEVRDFLRILFGSFEAPDPEVDWKGFYSTVKLMLSNERDTWNPIKKKPTPWIDMKQLDRCYGGYGFFPKVRSHYAFLRRK